MSSKLDAESPAEKSVKLIMTIENSIKNGVRHFRKSDGKFLSTVESVLVALRAEGGVKKAFPERRSKGGIILP